MIDPIELVEQDIPGRGKFLVMRWSTARVESLMDSIEVKKQLEIAIRSLALTFEKKTRLPVISIHLHDPHEVGAPPFWKATVKLP